MNPKLLIRQEEVLCIFTIAHDPLTKRTTYSGNITLETAVELIQQVQIVKAVEEQTKLEIIGGNDGRKESSPN